MEGADRTRCRLVGFSGGGVFPNRGASMPPVDFSRGGRELGEMGPKNLSASTVINVTILLKHSNLASCWGQTAYHARVISSEGRSWGGIEKGRHWPEGSG
jgi:hypothetical protein